MSVGTSTRRSDPSAAANVGMVMAWGFAGLTILSNIVWILASGSTRDALTISGVLLFFLASVSHSLASQGLRWTLVFFLVTCLFGWAIEAVGTSTGIPFGDYTYADRLGWTVGSVPAVIPLAWSMMAYPVFVVVSATGWGRAARVGLSAALLASWDLFLDPQMVAEGHWIWVDVTTTVPGVPGIPFTNFLGWVVGSLVLMSLLTLLLPDPRTAPLSRLSQPMVLLCWVYAGSILANAVFLDRPAVAVVGGIGMGIPVALLVVGLRRAYAKP